MLYHIPVKSVKLPSDIIIPTNARGLVIFAHGSGSSRKSPRNNFVAEEIRKRNIGTVLFDLLTEEEDRIYTNRFNIPLLTDRLIAVTKWLEENAETQDLIKGYFGASTGAASALKASIKFPDTIKAVVSRGGRVDMASEILDFVVASALFIVGGADYQVLQLNKSAFEKLNCDKKLEIIKGGDHLFTGPGQLEEVARIAADWFEKKLNVIIAE